jgi:xanthine/uracil/vitamin C permease (AzgA family)
MMSHTCDINWHDLSEAVPAFLTLVMMPFTFSITNGILFGLAASFAFYVTTGECYTDLKNYLSNRNPYPPFSTLFADSGLVDYGTNIHSDLQYTPIPSKL